MTWEGSGKQQAGLGSHLRPGSPSGPQTLPFPTNTSPLTHSHTTENYKHIMHIQTYMGTHIPRSYTHIITPHTYRETKSKRIKLTKVSNLPVRATLIN